MTAEAKNPTLTPPIHAEEQTSSEAPSDGTVSEVLVKEALEKYRELHSYSTDVLLKEQERFNRADEKAAKYATTFVFLLGVVAFFGKWVLDKLQWPNFPLELPPDTPLCMAAITGLLALLLSAVGWLLANHAIKLQPVVSRPLDQKTLDFFEKESLLNIYYGFARENSNAYAKNRGATDRKHTILKWAHRLMIVVLGLLSELVVMYCLQSWCGEAK